MEASRGNVLAYQFEPEVDNIRDDSSATSEEESDTEENVIDEQWCKCSNCSEMNSKKENLCCHSLKALEFIRGGKGKDIFIFNMLGEERLAYFCPYSLIIYKIRKRLYYMHQIYLYMCRA